LETTSFAAQSILSSITMITFLAPVGLAIVT